jgi:hypothetical protein
MFRPKRKAVEHPNLKTRRAYKEDVREFVAFTALKDYMGPTFRRIPPQKIRADRFFLEAG